MKSQFGNVQICSLCKRILVKVKGFFVCRICDVCYNKKF